MGIHVHAPDGGTIPGALCEQDGDLTTVRRDVTCPECDEILDADYTTSDWPALIRGFAEQLRAQQQLWMRARSPRRAAAASRPRIRNGKAPGRVDAHSDEATSGVTRNPANACREVITRLRSHDDGSQRTAVTNRDFQR